MSEEQPAGIEQGEALSPQMPTRRTLLRIGAVAVPAVMTISPAWATGNLAASALNCRIPIPGRVNAEGVVNGPGTTHSPPSSDYTGRHVKLNTAPSGVTKYSERHNAHKAYIQKLTRGTPGFTCFASVKRF